MSGVLVYRYPNLRQIMFAGILAWALDSPRIMEVHLDDAPRNQPSHGSDCAEVSHVASHRELPWLSATRCGYPTVARVRRTTRKREHPFATPLRAPEKRQSATAQRPRRSA